MVKDAYQSSRLAERRDSARPAKGVLRAGLADWRQRLDARLHSDLFGSQIQGDLIGASQWRIYQWRIYQGVAKEFGSATSDSFP